MLLQTNAIYGPVFKNLSSTITRLWVVKTAYDSSEQQQIAVSIESYWKQKETQNNKDHTLMPKINHLWQIKIHLEVKTNREIIYVSGYHDCNCIRILQYGKMISQLTQNVDINIFFKIWKLLFPLTDKYT